MFANGPQWIEHRLALERLDEVRLDRLLEQHRHRARGAELLGGDGLAVVRVGDRDRAEARAQIVRGRATIATIAITSDAAVMSKPVSRG